MTPEASPWFPVPVPVLGAARETRDTTTLRLDVRDRPELRAFRPGQFLMLHAFGIGEVPISVAGLGRDGALLHTVRAVGPATAAIVRVRRGDRIGVRGPYGAGWPLEAAEGHDVVLVSGGLGLAPVRAALERILAERGRYRRVILCHGARSPGDLLYRRELDRWSARRDLEVALTVDRADEGWPFGVGTVPALLRRTALAGARTVALLCGPEPMMRFAVRELRGLGVADDRIHLSLERNLVCGIGLCGHCQLGPVFVCKDGPVQRLDRIDPFVFGKEL